MMPDFFDQYLVYHPAPWVDRDWAQASRLPLEDVWFEADDGPRLFGWYVPAPSTTAVLLWCHGNAGNIIHRLDNLAELHRIGLSVFLFDYRGYGRSSGRPSEAGLYRDATAAYAHVAETRRIPPGRIVLFGRSLGAAIAGDLGSRRPAAGLILESAFPSVEALARAYYFGFPGHWFVAARFPLADRLKEIRMPVLVVHGDRDEVVPFELGRQVFEAAHEPKSFYAVPGADHNNLYAVGGAAYFRRLKQFVLGVLS
ncbi:MAG TPA: alpha/beta hydrolase [Candidatus Acidoferrum sp.]|nr:alpha/beta hydrolase [Candidatus Acidoferrum sp.]